MNTLPAEVLQLIWRNVYNSVIKEIREFIILGRCRNAQIYMYRKPNALNPEHIYFTLLCTEIEYHIYTQKEEYIFQSVEKYAYGGRKVHWLKFYEAILYMKHHPTGRENSNCVFAIEHATYDSDSSYEE